MVLPFCSFPSYSAAHIICFSLFGRHAARASVCKAVCVLQRSNGAGRAMWGLGPHLGGAHETRAGLVRPPHAGRGQHQLPVPTRHLPLSILQAPGPRPALMAGFRKDALEESLASPLGSSKPLPSPRNSPPFFGKGPPLFFPEGGSERKKMTPLEDLSILLQNRWSGERLVVPCAQERGRWKAQPHRAVCTGGIQPGSPGSVAPSLRPAL